MSDQKQFELPGVKENMRELIDQLNDARRLYHRDGESFMSDRMYNKKKKELRDMEYEYQVIYSDSPTQKQNRQVVPGVPEVVFFPKFEEKIKVKNVADLDKFLGSELSMISWSIDGASMILKYNHGELFQAILVDSQKRSKGKEITNFVSLFRNLPIRIPEMGLTEVRGIGTFLLDEYKTVNTKNGDLYDSPRQMAEETLQADDPNTVADRSMLFIASEIKLENTLQYDLFTLFKLLWSYGFDTPDFTQYIKATDKKIGRLSSTGVEKTHLICNENGVPIFYNMNRSVLEALTLFDYHKTPLPVIGVDIRTSAKMAYFMSLDKLDDQPTFASRNLHRLDTHITKTGLCVVDVQITPTAWNKNRIVISNMDTLESLKLGVNDVVEVHNQGDIISITKNKTDHSTKLFKPQYCPCCGRELIEKKIGNIRALFCENPICRKIPQALQFCSEHAANIPSLNVNLLSLFYLSKIIASPADLYTKLEENKGPALALLAANGRDEHTFETIIKEIDRSKHMTMGRFLYCLGIPLLTPMRASVLAKAFGDDIQKFSDAVEARKDFSKIAASPTLSKNILEWFDDFDHLVYFGALRSSISVGSSQKNDDTNSISGKIIVITGTLRSYTRDEANQLIRQKGGIPASTVTRQTDFLVSAASPGNTKLNRAKQLGIKIITEQQFLSMCR